MPHVAGQAPKNMLGPVPKRSARLDHEALQEEAARSEIPAPALCVKLAKCSADLGQVQQAYGWLARAADGNGPYVAWASAAAMIAKLEHWAAPDVRRSVRVALAGSYTVSQLGALLRVAALRRGVHVSLHEAGFDTYSQEILDGDSQLYAFDPDYVIIAPHEGAIRFPSQTQEAEQLLDGETARWQGLWEAIRTHSQARVIQHNLVVRPDTAWGHVSVRVPGSRDEMLRALNTRLAKAAGEGVLLVDCDRVAATFGKARWFDDRYWYLSKQAVALDALPELARHTAALLAAAEGLSSKCLVLDLDNTLWGGVIAEDGLAGIRLGDGPQGEAYVAFQEYVLALRARGILLAVVSKNNDADAREPFERHPDMRLDLSDFAVFLANWTDKATNLKRVASELNLGLDSLVFVDDNPAEREAVRQLSAGVEVVALPTDPSGYIRAVSDALLFESVAVTSEDLARADQYRARAAAAALEEQASSLEEFYASLGMEAFLAPFDELNLSRIMQLVGKTNQFNLTTRRHGPADVQAFMEDDSVVTFYLRLRDHFGDHGLVGLLIARQEGDVLDIDTWLMSCRVIGRTVENKMLARLCEVADGRGCNRLRGTFIPTSKNGVVRDLFERLGFTAEAEAEDGETTWIYDIAEQGIPVNGYIRTAGDRLAPNV
jgi:FkbH-like protein